MQEREAIERYLDEACSGIRRKRVAKEFRAELEDHILTKVEHYLEVGYDLDQAEAMALADMGEAAPVARQMGKIHNKMPRGNLNGAIGKLFWGFLLISIPFLYFQAGTEIVTSETRLLEVPNKNSKGNKFWGFEKKKEDFEWLAWNSTLFQQDSKTSYVVNYMQYVDVANLDIDYNSWSGWGIENGSAAEYFKTPAMPQQRYRDKFTFQIEEHSALNSVENKASFILYEMDGKTIKRGTETKEEKSFEQPFFNNAPAPIQTTEIAKWPRNGKNCRVVIILKIVSDPTHSSDTQSILLNYKHWKLPVDSIHDSLFLLFSDSGISVNADQTLPLELEWNETAVS